MRDIPVLLIRQIASVFDPQQPATINHDYEEADSTAAVAGAILSKLTGGSASGNWRAASLRERAPRDCPKCKRRIDGVANYAQQGSIFQGHSVVDASGPCDAFVPALSPWIAVRLRRLAPPSPPCSPAYWDGTGGDQDQ